MKWRTKLAIIIIIISIIIIIIIIIIIMRVCWLTMQWICSILSSLLPTDLTYVL